MTVERVPATWRVGPERPQLEPDGIHVWRFSLHAPHAAHRALEATLDSDETARASRFATDDLRHRYVVAHARLRHVLARYLAVHPKDVAIDSTEEGKPLVSRERHSQTVEFSFSHSGDIGLVAVVRERRVGVDVETYRERMDIDLVARRQFTAPEAKQLAGLAEDERTSAFYRCWTRKEAYTKALGTGIATGLDRFEVTFAAEQAPRIVRCVENSPDLWSVVALPMDTGYEAAAVIEGPVTRVECFLLNPDHD